MKQGQLFMARLTRPSRWSPEGLTGSSYTPIDASVSAGFAHHGLVCGVGRLLEGLFNIVWFAVSLPVRLVIGIISLLGRLAGIFLGFALMVVGMALWAGPLFVLGIPLFLVGLFLTLRCLS
jgi:hypothetical protein